MEIQSFVKRSELFSLHGAHNKHGSFRDLETIQYKNKHFRKAIQLAANMTYEATKVKFNERLAFSEQWTMLFFFKHVIYIV